MKYRYAVLFFIAGFLIQSTVMVHFAVFGVSPNIVLCLVILFPFLYGGNQGAVLGVLFGLMQDICFSAIIGPGAFGCFAVALFMGLIKKLLYRDSILSLFFASAIGTTMFYFLTWGLSAIFGGTYGFLYVLKDLPVLIMYHFAVMILFYLTVGRRAVRHPQDRYLKGNMYYYE